MLCSEESLVVTGLSQKYSNIVMARCVLCACLCYVGIAQREPMQETPPTRRRATAGKHIQCHNPRQTTQRGTRNVLTTFSRHAKRYMPPCRI